MLPKDNALRQKSPGGWNDAHDCQDLNMHNFLKTWPTGANKVFIDIYAKYKC